MKEILKNLVETMTLPEDSYLEQDAEILEIFVEEIEEIFEELNPLFTTWFANPTDQETLVTIRRHFHTLKGSGRMVGAKSAGELAWTVEDTLNRVLSGTVTLDTDIQKYAKTVFNLYQYKLYPIFKQVGLIDLDLRPLVLLGQQLQQNQTPEPALEELLVLADQLTATDMPTGLELADAAVETAVESSEDVMTAEEMSQTEVAQEAAADASLLAETLAIFVEEAEEHLATIDQFLAQDQIHSQDYNGLIRALHTLRGSSSMAQIDQVFQASSKVENLFKTFVQDEIESTSKETALLVQYAEFVRDYLHVLRQGYCDGLDVIYATFSKAWDSYGFSTSDTEDSNPQGLVSRLIELNIDRLLDAEFEFDKLAQAQFPSYLEELSAQAQLLVEHTDNRASVGIHQFTEELKAAYDSVLAKPILLNSEYGYELFAQAHQEFIHLFDTLAAGQRVTVTEDIQKTLNDLTAFVQQDIDAIALEDAETSVSDNAVERAVVAEPDVASAVVASESSGTVNLAQLSQRIASDQQNMHADDANKDFDPELLDIFLEEAEELLVGMDEDVNTWSKDASDTSALNNLMRYLHTLKGGANMISATHIGLIAHNLESIYERIINNQIVVSPALIQIIRLVQDDIADRIQTIRDERVDYAATQSIAILGNIVSLAQGDADVSVTSAVTTAQPEQVIEAEEVDAQPELAAKALQDTTADLAEDDIAIADEASLEDAVTASFEPVTQTASHEANAESEDEQLHSIVVETFREEAEEILDAADQRLKQWFEQRSDRSVLLQLQRAAHSLKGGARMAEIESVAQIAYQLESAFEQFAVHQFNSNVYDALLQTTLAWLRDAIFKADYTDYDSLKSSLSAMQFVDVSAQLPERLTHNDLLSPSRSYEFVQGDGTEPPAMSGEWGETTKLDNSNEMIRISADLVEKMIDLSGENSINRSRIEMELGQLGGTLNEMELAIKRLADQLRRMEGELESQIIAKHGSENSRYADFDPLEMDQYSSLNQLSKSLAESASDLVDFKSTLADKIRDAEGLLLQQSRIQAEIQESLMRTRLVPFSRLLPRLQRIVRQTSSTLNRPTELVVNNTEGELDRTILERLVTPFEHMLRNAVDHGIEDPVQRAAANKSEVGKIELNITRQGTDVVVTFVDDGKGIDDAKIKEKALSLGLIKADQNLDKNEILQYIFHPGFTTAKSVTQISGRGVGLDVVQSEIKALGGHVSVDSTLGQGTTFSTSRTNHGCGI